MTCHARAILFPLLVYVARVDSVGSTRGSNVEEKKTCEYQRLRVRARAPKVIPVIVVLAWVEIMPVGDN